MKYTGSKSLFFRTIATMHDIFLEIVGFFLIDKYMHMGDKESLYQYG